MVLQVEDTSNQGDDKKVKEEDTDMKDAETDVKSKDTKSEDTASVKKEDTSGEKGADKEEQVKKEKTPIPMPEKPQLQLHGKLCTTGVAFAASVRHGAAGTRGLLLSGRNTTYFVFSKTYYQDILIVAYDAWLKKALVEVQASSYYLCYQEQEAV